MNTSKNSFMHANWNNTLPLIESLSQLATDLQKWSKDVFHNLFRKKRFLLARIAGVHKALSFNQHKRLIKLES